jgi:hypothetical protein
LEVWGPDAGDFPGRRVIWSALNALAPAKSAPLTEIDLSRLEHVRPYTLATLAALGALSDGKARLTLPKTHAARDYVVRSGLVDFFVAPEAVELERSRRTVPVRQLTSVSPTFADEITSAWEREFNSMPSALRRAFANHLDEVIRNALSHSESPIGCIVAAQVYPTEGFVEVAILDLGITIKRHLTLNPEHSWIHSDEEAIIRATREGTTGTPPGMLNRLGEPNSGVGLFELRQYCEAGGGTFTIASGMSHVSFEQRGEPLVLPFSGGFPGCLVNIRFRV